MPVRPRLVAARPPAPANRTSTSNDASAIPATRRVSADGARRSPKKPIAIPASASTTSIAPISTPSWCPALVRAASDIPSLESACLEKSQPTTGAAPTPPTSSTRARAQAQRHDAHPGDHADDERRQRATRVGQHQRDDHQPHRGVGKCGQQRVPGAPRAKPQAADRPHRCGQADRVPVAVRFLQTRVEARFAADGQLRLAAPSSAARKRRPRRPRARRHPAAHASPRAPARRSATAAANTPL